jgi:hypothetical protein
VRRRGFVFASSQAEPASCWKGEGFDDETGGLEEPLSSDTAASESGDDDGSEDDEGEEGDEGNEGQAEDGGKDGDEVAVELEVDLAALVDGAALLATSRGVAVGGVAELAAGYLVQGDADMGPLKPGENP